MTLFHKTSGSGVNFDGGAVSQWAKYKTNRSSYDNYSGSDIDLSKYLEHNDDVSEEEKEAQRIANENARLKNSYQKVQNVMLGVQVAGECVKVVSSVGDLIGGMFDNAAARKAAAGAGATEDVSEVSKASSTATNSLKEAMTNYEKTGDYDGLKQAISTAKSTKSTCESTLASLENSVDVSAKEGELKNATDEFDKKDNALTNANNAYDTALKEKDEYEKGEYAKTKEEYDTKNKAVSDADKDLGIKTQALQDTEKAETDAQGVKAANQTALETAKGEVTEKTTLFNNAVQSANAARASYNALMSNPNATPDQKSTAKANLKTAEKAQKDAEKALDAAKQEQVKAENNLKKAEEELNKATKAKENAQTAKNEAEKALSDAKAAFEGLGDKMQEVQKNLDAKKKDVSEKETVRNSAQVEKDEAKFAKEEAEKVLKQTKKDVENKKKQVKKDIASIEATITKAEQQVSYREAGSKNE